MSKQNEKEEIRLAPPSPKLQTDGASQWMVWEATAPRRIQDDEATNLEQSLSTGKIMVTTELASPDTIRLTVRQVPTAEYAELYLAGIRALFRLEKCVGRLTAIEGIPRERWDVNFITARQFGPFE